MWPDERCLSVQVEGLRGPNDERKWEVVEDEDEDDGVPEKVLGEVWGTQRFERLEFVFSFRRAWVLCRGRVSRWGFEIVETAQS